MTSNGDQPCLELRGESDLLVRRVALSRSPFRIGRSDAAELVLRSPRVSKLHAEVVLAEEAEAEARWAPSSHFVLRDLGSRNGTFVNGERVERQTIRPGDVLHVGHQEIRFVLARPTPSEFGDDATLGGLGTEEEELRLRATRDLYRIISGKAVQAVFQPILRLADEGIVGYEALGRATLPSADYDATSLFAIAADRGRADELSRLMRTVACADVPHLPPGVPRVFMNVHPDEMTQAGLIAELERASALVGERILVAEIHEGAITDPAAMRRLRTELHQRGMELAYDDFGAGRSRLMELAEVPPDYLKLDMRLIRDIDQSQARQDLVAALVKVLTEAGIQIVAEGIETPAERAVCEALGCSLGQGFLFRHPLSVERFRDTVC
ncbi:MAG: EAL domain-containing protein [Sandaracinaceae bacterium]